MADQTLCNHLKAIKTVSVGTEGVCEECIKHNQTWVHLRTCQTCNVTLCCDDSPQQHMTKHYHAVKHPVIASAQPGEKWLWCYPDELFVEY